MKLRRKIAKSNHSRDIHSGRVKSSICVLILNTGFEAVGNYCPIDVENVNINTGKES
jgi:hypothetical protein